MAMPEKTKIWSEIKAALPAINKSGSNGVVFLLWSQDKNLEQVKEKIREIIAKLDEEHRNKSEEKEEYETQ